MKITVESINTVLSKVGLKLQSKDGKVQLSSAKIELMAEAKTIDGQAIATPADAWAEGVEVYVIDAEGNPTPAPDGEYELEDGSKIVVAGGLVAEMMEKAAEGEQEMSTEDIAAIVTALGEQVNSLTEQVNALTAERDNANTELAKVKDTNASLTKEIAKLSKAPAANSTKQEFAKAAKEEPAKPLHKMTFTERVAANLNK